MSTLYLELCCSKVIMSGVNGNVIMSGYGMRTLTMKEEKRLEIIQRVFRRELDSGGGKDGDRSHVAA